jgi:anti-sigma regulatory factor (Ser/Thr protein kinase)
VLLPPASYDGLRAMTLPPFADPNRFRVEAEDDAVSDARRRILALVRSWDVPLPQDTFGDLELLSSEVITNAVRYTRAPCMVTVRWTGVRVRIEVTDADPVRPQPRDASLESENGRGLLLVESLAAAWGSVPDQAGKVVWFEVGPPNVMPPALGRRLADQIRAVAPFASTATRPLRGRRPGRLSRYAMAGTAEQ